MLFFFFQAEDGIRALVRSRGLGDVYKRQAVGAEMERLRRIAAAFASLPGLMVLAVAWDALLLSLIHI